MTDHTTGAVSGDMFDDYSDQGFSVEPGVLPATAAEQLSARARTQRRLRQARTSVRDATTRARQSATLPSVPLRQTGEATDEAGRTSPTLAARAQAYRVHILRAGAAAVIALLVAILNRRATPRHSTDAIDLGDWHLHAQPTGEEREDRATKE